MYDIERESLLGRSFHAFLSLMALELKQRLENGLGIELPIESLMQDPNLTNLSTWLLTLLEASS
ncbi:MAG TPA: acyl carrier protein [Ktedonobacteraceae bacterium]